MATRLSLLVCIHVYPGYCDAWRYMYLYMYVLTAMGSRVRVHKAILSKLIVACVETPH